MRERRKKGRERRREGRRKEEEGRGGEERRDACVWKSKVDFQELMSPSTVESGNKTHRHLCEASTLYPLCHLTTFQDMVLFVYFSL